MAASRSKCLPFTVILALGRAKSHVVPDAVNKVGEDTLWWFYCVYHLLLDCTALAIAFTIFLIIPCKDRKEDFQSCCGKWKNNETSVSTKRSPWRGINGSVSFNHSNVLKLKQSQYILMPVHMTHYLQVPEMLVQNTLLLAFPIGHWFSPLDSIGKL